jgi:trk system potassium uptake protein TrkA
MTARFLLRRRHEVVIIERNKERIESLAGELDCGFLLGDGSKPALLREADPERTAVLFCLTGNDQANILASLVGRSLGFARIVTKIDDPEFEHICIELGLEDMIIPSRTIGRYLADLFQGMNLLDLSGVIKDEARIFTFVARHDDELSLDELKLPARSRLVCLYRGGKFVPLQDDSRLQEDDEVVLITHADNLPELHERWGVQMETVRKH